MTRTSELMLTLHTVELVALVYLALALFRVSGRLAKLEGRQEERNHRGGAS